MNAIHILSKCREIHRWREQLLNRKWLVMNEDITFKKSYITLRLQNYRIEEHFYRKYEINDSIVQEYWQRYRVVSVTGVAKNLMLVVMFSCIMYFVLYSLEGCMDTINFLFHSTSVLYTVYLSCSGRHGFSHCC